MQVLKLEESRSGMESPGVNCGSSSLRCPGLVRSTEDLPEEGSLSLCRATSCQL